VVAKGEDSDDSCNPRFPDRVIINDESMRSLLALPDETPPLRGFGDRKETAASMDWGLSEDAFVWLLVARARLLPPEHGWEEWYGGGVLVKLNM
jgi:hypothetical protein